MICYKEEKRDKASKGGEPVERTHGEIVVLALPEGKLRREVGEREEPVRSVEFLIVFAVTALNLAVVAGSVRPYEFVLDTEFGKGFLKERRTVRFGIVQPVVGLDTLNGIGEFLNNMAKEEAGRIGAVFLKGFEIAEAGILINEGVLVKLLIGGITDQASRRDKLDVDLPAPSGIGHLLIGLGNILGIWQFHSHLTSFSQETVKA